LNKFVKNKPMADITNAILEKHLKKWSLKANFVAVMVAVLTAASIGYGFYYKTNSQLDQNKSDIGEIKEDVDQINDKITNSTVFQYVSAVEMKNFDDRLEKVEAGQIRTEKKLDRVLEILIEN